MTDTITREELTKALRELDKSTGVYHHPYPALTADVLFMFAGKHREKAAENADLAEILEAEAVRLETVWTCITDTDRTLALTLRRIAREIRKPTAE